MTHKAEQGREQWTATRVGHHLPMWPWPQTSFQLRQGGTGHRVRGPSHLEAPSPHDLQPFSPSPPHCPASAPPRCTGCQVIAPHGHGMEVFRKRKKEKSPEQVSSSQESPGKTEQVAAQRPAPSTCSLALRQALPVEQVLLPAFGIGPGLGAAREAGTWRGEVARLLGLWEKRKRWKEAEGTHEGSSHEGPSWNGQSLPEAAGLTRGRGCS